MIALRLTVYSLLAGLIVLALVALIVGELAVVAVEKLSEL